MVAVCFLIFRVGVHKKNLRVGKFMLNHILTGTLKTLRMVEQNQKIKSGKVHVKLYSLVIVLLLKFDRLQKAAYQ